MTVYPFPHRKFHGTFIPSPVWDGIKVLADIQDLQRRVAQLEEAQVKHYVTATTTGTTLMDPR